MRMLGIETSCDETAVAILQDREVLADLIASQDDIHGEFGGIVPELASRRHLEMLPTMVTQALRESDVEWSALDGIAVTRAPGLIGSLLMGVAFAKAIAYAHNIPLIGVNHLEGHLMVAGLEYPDLTAPFLGLIVSGGHSSLYHVPAWGSYTLLGATRDDAAGEAYDKAAMLLGLGYPGGPKIDQLAHDGDHTKVRFPRPKMGTKGSPFEIGPFDMSFSGLKTAMLQQRQRADRSQVSTADLAAGFQHRVIEELTRRIVEAAQSTGCERVVVAGGVAANRGLRERLTAIASTHDLSIYIPSMRYCTDNAVMIAWAGQHHLAQGERHGLDMNATAREELMY
jgi:N6-L-threonylcarbamoyladenine synthase